MNLVHDIYCRWCNKQTIIGTLRRQFLEGGGSASYAGCSTIWHCEWSRKDKGEPFLNSPRLTTSPPPVHLPPTPTPPHSNRTKMQIVPYVCWNVEEGVVEWGLVVVWAGEYCSLSLSSNSVTQQTKGNKFREELKTLSANECGGGLQPLTHARTRTHTNTHTPLHVTCCMSVVRTSAKSHIASLNGIPCRSWLSFIVNRTCLWWLQLSVFILDLCMLQHNAKRASVFFSSDKIALFRLSVTSPRVSRFLCLCWRYRVQISGRRPAIITRIYHSVPRFSSGK